MDACLSEQNLSAFVTGTAARDEMGRWNEHLDACEPCAQRVAQLQAEQTEAMQPRSTGPSDRRDVGPGTRLGDFEIVRRVGQGGMGIVYEARQVSLDRKVALKVLPPGLGLTTSAVVRFHREAQAAAKLHHTNIVAVYVEGEDNGTCYYAMELIEGQGLDEFIRERAGNAGELRDPDATVTAGPTPTPAPTGSSSGSRSGTAGSMTGRDYFYMIARWIADAADALAYAHDNGVIHRDIKPSNLMLGSDGRVKLLDFVGVCPRERRRREPAAASARVRRPEAQRPLFPLPQLCVAPQQPARRSDPRRPVQADRALRRRIDRVVRPRARPGRDTRSGRADAAVSGRAAQQAPGVAQRQRRSHAHPRPRLRFGRTARPRRADIMHMPGSSP